MRGTKAFLFLTILASPLYVIRFSIFSFPTTLLEILILLTIGIWFYESGFKKISRIRLKQNTLNTFVLLFLLSGAISILVSPDKRGGLGVFKAYILEPIIIFYIARDVIKKKKDFYFILNALFFSALWVSVLSLIQGFTGELVFAPHEAASGRVHGFYNSANALGLYLGPILALSIYFLYKRINFLNYLLYFLLVSSAIVLSRSIGALAGLISIFVVFGIFSLVNKKPDLKNLIKRFLVAVFILLIAVSVYLTLNISVFTPSVSDPWRRETGNTLLIRACLWEGTKNLLSENLITGSGLSGFKEAYTKSYYTCDAEPLEYPHNFVFNFWTEMGVLGLFSFILLVFYYFKISFKPAVNKSLPYAVFSAALVYSLIHGLVDVPYFKNDLSLEFWVIYALLTKYQSSLT